MQQLQIPCQGLWSKIIRELILLVLIQCIIVHLCRAESVDEKILPRARGKLNALLHAKSSTTSSSEKLPKMENIQNVKVGPMPQSQFLKPFRMEFTQNGRKRYWDFIKLHESVSIVIYNTSRKVLIFVKQFRPAVYYNTAVASKSVCNEVQGEIDWSKVPASLGVTIELCAGILDNPDLSAQEIAKQEVLEECGYDVPLGNFQYVISYRSGIGVSGDKQNLFYAEVTDDMKVGPGGGLVEEGEYIDVVEMTIPEARKFMAQETVPSPGGFLFGLQWFLSNKVSSDA